MAHELLMFVHGGSWMEQVITSSLRYAARKSFYTHSLRTLLVALFSFVVVDFYQLPTVTSSLHLRLK